MAHIVPPTASSAAPKRSLPELLQSVPKPVLYLILFFATALPLFLKIPVPNEPQDSSKDFYENLMALKEGDKVLIASDWTNSTRGESSGDFEALLRILFRKKIKFAVYSTGAAEAPQVARDVIRTVNADEMAHGQPGYKPFEDYVVLGYFPNSEGTTNAINNNVRLAFSGKKDFPPNSPPRDVMQSPVFAGVNQVSDFKYLIVVTASKTSEIVIERVSKTPLMFMVTGVMAPETRNYYTSKQIVGMVGGLKGVYDLETQMDKGFPGKKNAGKGTAYYPALHFAVVLLIVCVVLGNVAMFMSRGKVR